MTDLLPLLREFHDDKLAMFLRHQAGARLIGEYDFNNAYQYIVNREDVQLSWLSAAIAELGGTVAEDVPVPERRATGKGATVAPAILKEDAVDASAFVERWRPRVDAMTNARHRGMLQVILGETLEHHRLFEQALAGRLDLLGRREDHVGARVGAVLPTRWVE